MSTSARRTVTRRQVATLNGVTSSIIEAPNFNPALTKSQIISNDSTSMYDQDGLTSRAPTPHPNVVIPTEDTPKKYQVQSKMAPATVTHIDDNFDAFLSSNTSSDTPSVMIACQPKLSDAPSLTPTPNTPSTIIQGPSKIKCEPLNPVTSSGLSVLSRTDAFVDSSTALMDGASLVNGHCHGDVHDFTDAHLLSKVNLTIHPSEDESSVVDDHPDHGSEDSVSTIGDDDSNDQRGQPPTSSTFLDNLMSHPTDYVPLSIAEFTRHFHFWGTVSSHFSTGTKSNGQRFLVLFDDSHTHVNAAAFWFDDDQIEAIAAVLPRSGPYFYRTDSIHIWASSITENFTSTLFSLVRREVRWQHN
jgi:hypothetical protein